MCVWYEIGPRVGVGRVGNGQEFYLGPDAIGALPIECDPLTGLPRMQGDGPVRVTRFKERAPGRPDEAVGRIRRQAAWFRVFRFDDDHPQGRPLEPRDGVVKVEWTVHLANKKSCWWDFRFLLGNTMYPDNAYVDAAGSGAPLRHDFVKGDDRAGLVLDAGCQLVSERGRRVPLVAPLPEGWGVRSGASVEVASGGTIRPGICLGEAMVTSEDGLLVVGAFGENFKVTRQREGEADIDFDDIADGPVTCTLTFEEGEPVHLRAWCLIGPPKYAPEIVNVVSLDDIMEDVGVRHREGRLPMFHDGGFDPRCRVNFERDVRPILERPAAYRWVTTLPSLGSLSPPPFDVRDNTRATADLRRTVFRLHRRPGTDDAVSPEHDKVFATTPSAAGQLLMPPLPGDNPNGTGGPTMKMLSLTEVQYFVLEQWSRGLFDDRLPPVEDEEDQPLRLTRANVGNCVGGPFAPGVEATWSMRNPALYEGPHRIRARDLAPGDTLSHDRDETEDERGCEPGDLTKRLAVPWQDDFDECGDQNVGAARDDRAGERDVIPDAPLFQTFWWPPQVPDYVFPRATAIAGDLGQVSAGRRGVGWTGIGFIVNQVRGRYADRFPFLAEQERVEPAPPTDAPAAS